MIVLSGGTGTPKLLNGLKRVIPKEEIAVIVNTAEDTWISGNLVCPDIDTVIYTFADLIDEREWWGIRNDSFRTYNMLRDLGHDELIAIGDKDRATHILRTELLRNGMSLTASIRELTSKFGIKAKILPMTDDRVRTMIVTTGGVIHFQEFWVVRKGKAEVEDIFFDGIEDAELTNEVLNVLESEDSVLIGPSNPITSISPILRLGMDRILRNKFVIAISPIVGKKPISGPAAELMCAKGFEVSPLGISECYKDFLDVLIIDEGDECDLEGVDVLKTNIIMKGVKESAELAKFVLEILSLHNTERSQPGNGL